MTTLSDWAKATLPVVETDGAHPEKVVLTTVHDDAVWATWDASQWHDDIEGWATKVDSYLRTLAEEFPARDVSVCFTVYAAENEVLSRLPWKIRGKRKQGTGALMDSNAAATAIAFDNIALTIEKFQRLFNTQIDSARIVAEANAQTIFQQTELIKLMRQNAAIDRPETPEDPLNKLVGEHAGDFIELAKMALSKWEPGTKPN